MGQKWRHHKKKGEEKMNKDKCKTEGHQLKKEYMIVGYQCKHCKFYIRADDIPKTGFGHCPKCDAPKDKLDSQLWGSERIEYTCKNCGYSWQELM